MIKISPDEMISLYGPLTDVKTIKFLDKRFTWEPDEEGNVCIYSFVKNKFKGGNGNRKTRLNFLALKTLYEEFGLREGDSFVMEHSYYVNEIYRRCNFYDTNRAKFNIELAGFTRKYLPINTCKIDGKIVPIFHILLKNLDTKDVYHLNEVDEKLIHNHLIRYADALEREKEGTKVRPMMSKTARNTIYYYNPQTSEFMTVLQYKKEKPEGFERCKLLPVAERTFCLNSCLIDHNLYNWFVEEIGGIPTPTEDTEVVKTISGNSYNAELLFNKFLSNYENSDGWIVPYCDIKNADINRFYKQTGTTVSDYKIEGKDYLHKKVRDR